MRPNTRPRMSAINYNKTLSTISRHYWQELYEWHNSTDRSPPLRSLQWPCRKITGSEGRQRSTVRQARNH
uniref:Uncharacterized protein n=1 Tax=Anopheles atroparvus TaxID=41427 RepID=A0AAG5DQP4_ANOAO